MTEVFTTHREKFPSTGSSQCLSSQLPSLLHPLFGLISGFQKDQKNDLIFKGRIKHFSDIFKQKSEGSFPVNPFPQ
jgi:hypothetical protein